MVKKFEKFKMEEDNGDISHEGPIYDVRTDEYGNVYEGEFVSDRLNGVAIVRWTDGEIYEGEWENDKRCGTGILRGENGVVYEGEWRDDNECGSGKKILPNGDIREGNWRDGRLHGYGIVKKSNGVYLEGMFENNKLNGWGSYRSSKKGIYEGELKDNKRHGKGCMKFSNGDIYNGDWEDNWPNGEGTMEYSNGDIYKGEWLHDMDIYNSEFFDGECDDKNGFGTMKYSNGDIYIGGWHYGKRCSDDQESCIKYSNGDIYNGMVWYDKREGKGRQCYQSSDYIYDGLWKDDTWYGEGTFTFSSHFEMTSEWIHEGVVARCKQGKCSFVFPDLESSFHGNWKGFGYFNDCEGAYTTPNGDVFEGTWCVEKMTGNGYGKYIFANSITYIGGFSYGKKHGHGKYVYANNTLCEGIWDNDVFVSGSSFVGIEKLRFSWPGGYNVDNFLRICRESGMFDKWISGLAN